MGDDPNKSVVNPAGETWEVENLYVADSSILPTATGVPSMVCKIKNTYIFCK
jgi:choline dehydrogenase-like flavoprotein